MKHSEKEEFKAVVVKAVAATIQAREQEKKLDAIAKKIDAISAWVEAEQAKKTEVRRPTRIERSLAAACLMNPSREAVEADKHAVWAAKADDAGSADEIMNTMFHRPR